MKCPFCNGVGEIEAPEFKNKLLEEKRLAANTLREQGYSIREIMRIMKYKSPRSVHILIQK
jgi:hypothetical protein